MKDHFINDFLRVVEYMESKLRDSFLTKDDRTNKKIGVLKRKREEKVIKMQFLPILPLIASHSGHAKKLKLTPSIKALLLALKSEETIFTPLGSRPFCRGSREPLAKRKRVHRGERFPEVKFSS